MAELSPDQRQTMLNNRWFARLPSPVQDEIIRFSRLKRLRDGEFLFFQGQEADAWYGLVEGAMRFGSTSPDGKEAVFTFIEPGTWFGEISLFDGLPRAHNCKARGDTAVLDLAADDFQALLARHPVMHRHFNELHCQRFRLMYTAMEEWNMLPLDERLMRQLVGLARAYGKPQAGDVLIDIHLPQEELAQLLGVSRQRINQTLKLWERNGWVQFQYGRIVLRAGLFAEHGKQVPGSHG